MGGRVVAVMDWRAAALLKDNARLFEKAGLAGGRSRGERAAAAKHRSLTLREDGSCELQRFSPAAAVRRLGGDVAGRSARRTRDDQRG